GPAALGAADPGVAVTEGPGAPPGTGSGARHRRGLARVRTAAGLPPVRGGLVGEHRDGTLDARCEPAGVLVVTGQQRIAERHRDRQSPWEVLALAEDAPGSLDVDRHHRHVAALGDVGRAATERLAPAVRAASAFGEDQQAPAVVDERP